MDRSLSYSQDDEDHQHNNNTTSRRQRTVSEMSSDNEGGASGSGHGGGASGGRDGVVPPFERAGSSVSYVTFYAGYLCHQGVSYVKFHLPDTYVTIVSLLCVCCNILLNCVERGNLMS